jgi:hypothetical protein
VHREDDIHFNRVDTFNTVIENDLDTILSALSIESGFIKEGNGVRVRHGTDQESARVNGIFQAIS